MKLNQYESVDLSTLTDQIVVVAGNIENALRLLGVEECDYSKMDIVNFAIQLVPKMFENPDLTLEDIRAETEPKKDDPMLDILSKALESQQDEFSLDYAATEWLKLSARALTPSVKTRIGITLRQLGCKRIERRPFSNSRFLYVPPSLNINN